MECGHDALPSVAAERVSSEAPRPLRRGEILNACDALLGTPLVRGLGHAPALIYRNDIYSYGALEALVNQFARALKAAGISVGGRILLMLKDTPELVAGFLATMKIGGVAVALNTRYSAADLGFAITDADCQAMFIHRDFMPLLEHALADGVPRPPLLVVCDEVPDAPIAAISLAEFLGAAAGTVESEPTSPDDMAFWVYTSGTTGKAKAAVHRHGEILIADRHLGDMFGIKPGDRIFSSSKLFFTFALAHCLLGGLRLGATLILDDRWPHTEVIAEIVARHRPDVMFSVPTIYRNLLNDGRAKTASFRAIRTFISAGERLPPGVFRQWNDATGKPILDGIGATETLFLFIANTPGACRAGATGRQQPGVELKLLDDDGRLIDTPGELGVLWVRMDSLAAGYWNRPDKTQMSFDQGWYRTGDMFSFDEEGWWYHQGRSDDLFKVSGQWVSPTEIEDCALSVPGVVDVSVLGVPNSDGLTRLIMFVVPAPGVRVPDLAERIQDNLKVHLAIYKCPRNIHFVSEIPRTVTGKVQRFRLREAAIGMLSARTVKEGTAIEKPASPA